MRAALPDPAASLLRNSDTPIDSPSAATLLNPRTHTVASDTSATSAADTMANDVITPSTPPSSVARKSALDIAPSSLTPGFFFVLFLNRIKMDGERTGNDKKKKHKEG